MGKLVLGIIAVALLELAFLGYAAVEGTRNAAIYEVSGPFETGLELARVEEIPEFATPIPVVLRPAFERLTARTRVRSRSYTRIREPEETYPEFQPSTTIIRSGPGIPSGYTMVLVDYLPGLTPNYTPRPVPSNNKPKVNAKPSVSENVSPRTSPDTAKPRKAPFLLRTVPAVVKKPWKLMRSLASRFN